MRSLVIALLMLAQFTPSSPPPKYLTFSTAATAATASAGAKVSLFVDIVPNRGMHVYASGAKDYLPIALTLETLPGVTIGKIVYPKSELFLVPEVNEIVPVYQKPFRLTQNVTIGKSLKAGTTLAMTGTLKYQACDDKICYAPDSAPVAWTLKIN